jgi:hypothetical protein
MQHVSSSPRSSNIFFFTVATSVQTNNSNNARKKIKSGVGKKIEVADTHQESTNKHHHPSFSFSSPFCICVLVTISEDSTRTNAVFFLLDVATSGDIPSSTDSSFFRFTGLAVVASAVAGAVVVDAVQVHKPGMQLHCDRVSWVGGVDVMESCLVIVADVLATVDGCDATVEMQSKKERHVMLGDHTNMNESGETGDQCSILRFLAIHFPHSYLVVQVQQQS